MSAKTELVVIGGGLTGLAFAVTAAGVGIETLIVDPVPWPTGAAAGFDGRVTAIARGSRRLLEACDVWPHLADGASPIKDIVVGERHSPLTVHYDHKEVGPEPLGHIVENRMIRAGLVARAKQLLGQGLTLAVPDKVQRFERHGGGAIVHLESGGKVAARLVVAADGRHSPSRSLADIGVTNRAYAQTGIVATLAHEHPHEGVAVERFFSSGPLAILPMSGNRSSIVWAAENELAKSLTGLDDDAFIEELEERVGDGLGKISLKGPRWHYPLSLAQAHRYTDTRLALIGDAARAIHPIAGQGWNLALRDVGALAELVIDAKRLGLDPGGAYVLNRYARWRRFDSLALIAVTDGLNRLFANDVLPLRVLRELGLGLVQRTPPLKRFFMQHAMGVLGDLPRLMRGEAL